jgi:hypothetical protein
VKRFLLILAACQHADSKAPPCASAYASLESSGEFGGKTYGGPGAVAFGLACATLSSADTACLSSGSDVTRCSPAAQAVATPRPLAPSSNPPAVTPQQITAVVDAVCACTDAACLVDFASRHHEAVDGVLGSNDHDALTRLGQCLLAVKR